MQTETQTTAVTLARDLTAAFEGKTRDNGEAFRLLKDDAPQWMTDAVHAAHGDLLPDDWRYEAAEDCANSIGELDDEDDPTEADSTEYADSVDVYSSDLAKWLGSHGARRGYVEEAAAEFGSPEPFDVDRSIMQGQYYERTEIWGLLAAFLVEEAERQNDEAS
jgi:hypothetical protein